MPVVQPNPIMRDENRNDIRNVSVLLSWIEELVIV